MEIPLRKLRQQVLQYLSNLLAIHLEYYARPCPELQLDSISVFQYYDGTLKNHIAYLRSVLQYADQSDQYARACKYLNNTLRPTDMPN
jgi:hypothetical protein